MQEIKFRTPVKCQNGHKALWYWSISTGGIGEVIHYGVIHNKCNCPKEALNEGYTRDGDDQQYSGYHDKNGNEIYEGDIRIGHYYCCNEPKRYTIVNVMKFDLVNSCFSWDGQEMEPWMDEGIVGNVYENPDLLRQMI
jgi:hypothetical protein